MKRTLLAIAVPMALGLAANANAFVLESYEGAAHEQSEFAAVFGSDTSALLTFDFDLATDSYLTFEGLTDGGSVFVALYDDATLLTGWMITEFSGGFITNSPMLSAGSYSLTTTPYSAGSYSFETTVTAVPEPESYAMFLAGLGMLGLVARRKLDGKA